MTYALTFATSTLFFYVSGRCKGFLEFVLATFALLVPCVIAGLRDITIGTDVLTYGVWTFQDAAASSLTAFMKEYASIAAPGFNLFSWLTCWPALGLEFYLFMIQLATILPIYLVCRRASKEYAWLGMLGYLLLLFPFSLNGMKQMIAVSLVLVSGWYALEKKPLRFVLFVTMATLFHQTAVIALALYPFIVLVDQNKSVRAFFGKHQALILLYVVLGVLVAIFIFGQKLVDIFSALKESYAYQANAQSDGINNSGLVLLAAFLLCFAAVTHGQPRDLTTIESAGNLEQAASGATAKPVCWSVESDLYRWGRTSCLLVVIGCIMIQFNVIASSLMRFSYYGLVFTPLLLTLLPGMGLKDGRPLTAFSLMVLVAYFVYAYVISGGNDVYPYTSTLLGIS